jgi:UDP-glucose:glycoprotein glucosyltransferase
MDQILASSVSEQIHRIRKVLLLSRQYSPRLETFRQMALRYQEASERLCCWAVVNGREVVSDPSTLESIISGTKKIFSEGEESDDIVLDIDHLYPVHGALGRSPITVSLYGPIDSDCSQKMHDSIVKSIESSQMHVLYVWRPISYNDTLCAGMSCSTLGVEGDLTIPGYGVELAIKNMEYNARDDSSSSETENDGVKNTADSSVETSVPDNEEKGGFDMERLGLQAVEMIFEARNSLVSLRNVSQNFPNLIDIISKTKVSDKVSRGIDQLSRYLAPEAKFLLINGISVDLENLNWHSLIDIVRKESHLVSKLQDLGLPAQVIPDVIRMRGDTDDSAGKDEFRLDFNPSKNLFWISDVEKDEAFEGLPTRLNYLLQPAFMGQAPAVKRNVFTMFLIIDVGTRGGATALWQTHMLLKQGLPVRVGVIPVKRSQGPFPKGSPQEFSDDVSNIYVGLGLAVGERVATEIFADAASALSDNAWEDETAFPKAMFDSLKKSLSSRWRSVSKHLEGASLRNIQGFFRDPEQEIAKKVEEWCHASNAMVSDVGIGDFAEAGGILVMNGILQNIESVSMWRPMIINSWQSETATIQRLVYDGELADSVEDLLGEILLLKSAIPRFNPRVISKPSLLGNDEIVQEPQSSIHIADPRKMLKHLESMDLVYFSGMSFIRSSEEQVPITHWLIVNPSNATGLRLIDHALSHESSMSRVGLIINVQENECLSSSLSDLDALLLLLSMGVEEQASEADHFDTLSSIASLGVDEIMSVDVMNLVPESMFESRQQLTDALKQVKKEDWLKKHCLFVRNFIGLRPGVSGVLTNGRFIVSRFEDDIVNKDFLLLEQVAIRKQFANDKLLGMLRSSQGSISDLAALTSSIMESHNQDEDNSITYQGMQLFKRLEKDVKIKIPSKLEINSAPLQVQVLLDPLSKAAQQVSDILCFLRETLHVDIELILNPRLDYSDLPLKTYYRYVTPSLGKYTESQRPMAVFTSLPLKKTLTLGMDVPEMWLVSPIRCRHDLDNIHLDSLSSGEQTLQASFELNSILVTGMCVDFNALENGRNSQVHPRGVQLNLGTKENPIRFDTLVMSNLGYFQLKASPGIWDLRLAEGRSKDIYSIRSVIGRSEHSLMRNKAVIKDDAAVTTVASFSGEHVLLLLNPNKGHAGEDVLDDTPLKKAAKKSPADDTIHIFTVASGHMYERLQKIMILSATKRASRKVKFWFIDNYMSPQMKEFLPVMAEQYGFEFEYVVHDYVSFSYMARRVHSMSNIWCRFVTYKWPSWLHKQTEKQRIIWAYKILFLDVLFPLGLKKVIFCDSDQVIRADLAELWDYDLKGAPYGYTPFCDNNKEMDNFRFWKQGFWETHLKGKPYHISALYVVDLEKFRSMAAGDQLRVMYDQLSKDPNSLANLDQDLPNFAQHQVPIASLPQEWLWCETWCGNVTRPQAKTIDLCNNPLTKEPKLKSARRIIAEWPDLNREVEEFTANVERYLKEGSPETMKKGLSSHYKVQLLPMVEGIVSSSSSSSGKIVSDHSEL